MAITPNPTSGRLDAVPFLNPFRGVLSSAPSNPQDGWMYIDSGTKDLYVYYDGNWWNIATLSTGNNNAGIPIGFGGLLHLTY